MPEPEARRKQFRVDRAIRRAERHLAGADPVMKLLIARHGRCPLAERNFEPFHMLANSIISQQLSTRAAATIKQRIGALVGVPFQADKVLAVPQELLRSAGLSAAKARYIHELAARVCDGRLNFIELIPFGDEQLIEKLSESPGIGRGPLKCFCFSVSSVSMCSPLAMPACSARCDCFTVKNVNRRRCCRGSPKHGGLTARSRAGICGARWKVTSVA
ncbi:MAG: hypothetical protein ABWZ38_05810 [Candidatus Binatia bacterium]